MSDDEPGVVFRCYQCKCGMFSCYSCASAAPERRPTPKRTESFDTEALASCGVILIAVLALGAVVFGLVSW